MMEHLARQYASTSVVSPFHSLAQIIENAWIAGYKQAMIRMATEAPLDLPLPTPSLQVQQDIAYARKAAEAALQSEHQRRMEETTKRQNSWPPPSKIDPSWLPVRHANGPVSCGGIAYYLTRKYKSDETANLDDLRTVTGDRVRPQDRPVCGACGEGIDPYSNADLDYTPHVIAARRRRAPKTIDEAIHQITETEMVDVPSSLLDPP